MLILPNFFPLLTNLADSNLLIPAVSVIQFGIPSYSSSKNESAEDSLSPLITTISPNSFLPAPSLLSPPSGGRLFAKVSLHFQT